VGKTNLHLNIDRKTKGKITSEFTVKTLPVAQKEPSKKRKNKGDRGDIACGKEVDGPLTVRGGRKVPRLDEKKRRRIQV